MKTAAEQESKATAAAASSFSAQPQTPAQTPQSAAARGPLVIFRSNN